MAKQQLDPAVQEALVELQRYLSDQLAPMMVTDSVELLLRCPPQLVAQAIHSWVSSQYRGAAAGAPISDCLFHAMKKIHLMSEFDLIGQEQIDTYLSDLGKLVLQLCPEADQEMFVENLSRLGDSESATTAQVEILHRQKGSEATATRPATATAQAAAATAVPPAPGVAPPGAAVRAAAAIGGGAASEEAVARGMNRFAYLLERMGQMGGSVAAAHEGGLQGQLLTTAAVNSRSDAEFEQYLQRMTDLGLEAKTEEIFRSLGQNLPGWALPDPVAAGLSEAEIPTSRPVEAMHRLITMAGNTEEGARRFAEMVEAAIGQFNEGGLVQAMTMFDLAERVADENRINPEVLRTIRQKTPEQLSEEQLRRYADQSELHGHLRKVLNFFPSYTAKGLLGDLADEPKRERRKLLLALLQAHGREARASALELLTAYVGGGNLDPQGYFQRNLVFLLRHIPRSDETGLDQELELLGQLVLVGNPLMVVKETIGALAQLSHEKAEQALIVSLREFEQALIKDEGVYPADELRILLDRITAALARHGGKNAARAVTAHAFQRHQAVGDSMSRIRALGATDLAADGELVERIVETLRNELPSKVLGFVVKKKNETVPHLIQALSGTSAPAVRLIFEEIVERFPDRGFAEAASKALAKLGASSRPSESKARVLTGDVELFGLPSLLQTLADSQVTGVLTLTDREEKPVGTMFLEQGKICGCRAFGLDAECAFYQLFETPVPGTFTFRGRDLSQEEIGGVIEVLPALLEAIRRHDEFQQARALIPDDLSLKPTGAKPTRPPADDEDPEFLRAVWLKASKGEHPASCQVELKVDSFRIRRLFAHWVEEGALQPT
jgi:hypothetical protein